MVLSCLKVINAMPALVLGSWSLFVIFHQGHRISNNPKALKSKIFREVVCPVQDTAAIKHFGLCWPDIAKPPAVSHGLKMERSELLGPPKMVKRRPQQPNATGRPTIGTFSVMIKCGYSVTEGLRKRSH